MADFRATFFFECNRNGWSESLYKTGLDNAAIMAAANLLAPARRACLNSFSTLHYIRVSNVDSARDAAFQTFLGLTGRGTAGGFGPDFQEEAAEEPWDAVNLRMFAGVSTWRSFLMRGLPTNALTLGGQLAAASSYINNLLAFRNLLLGNWALRKATSSGDNIPVTGVEISDGRIRNFQTAIALPGIAVGKTISIKFGRGVSSINGQWKVRLVLPGAPNIYVISTKQKINYGTYSANSALINLVNYTYPTITNSQVIGLTKKATGRPSYLPRGRRQVQRA